MTRTARVATAARSVYHLVAMSFEDDRTRYTPTVASALPDGKGGCVPCPELLTEEEAIRYLRLDAIRVEDPAGTLRYYRKRGLLRATQVGKSIRYRRIELERLLDKLTETNPR